MAETAPRSHGNVAELTVSELAGAIKSTLEDTFGYVRLRGEISGFRGPHSSGHCYFALKDERAKIEAVVWRGSYARLKVKPEEGLEVIATGKVTTFPGNSKYQIVIEALEPAGVGALMALLEERKKKFAAEGLFDEGRKRPLPFLPRVVGIITSPTGAVIRDMLHGFAERFPTRVVVWPVRVQGETSAAEVAAAIRGFNAFAPAGRLPRPDVLIVARGGGSLEDLWSFNDEAVIRAAAESTIPIVSAVGHETDWTLLDLVADARAPTPTKAAEWVVPKHADLLEQTGKLTLRLSVGMRRALDAIRRDLRSAARGLPRAGDLVALPRQRYDAAERRLSLCFAATVRNGRSRLDAARGRLPPPWSLVRLPRERFNAIDRRLGRGLFANNRAHDHALARVAARLSPRLLAVRVERTRDKLEQTARRAEDALDRIAAGRRMRLERTAARLSPDATRRRISQAAERLTQLAERASRALGHRVRTDRRRLASQAQLLASLGYRSVLNRGFALVRDAAGKPVRSAGGLGVGTGIEIEFADGRVGATTTAAAPVTARDSGPVRSDSQPSVTTPRPRRPGSEPGGDTGQGTLL